MVSRFVGLSFFLFLLFLLFLFALFIDLWTDQVQPLSRTRPPLVAGVNVGIVFPLRQPMGPEPRRTTQENGELLFGESRQSRYEYNECNEYNEWQECCLVWALFVVVLNGWVAIRGWIHVNVVLDMHGSRHDRHPVMTHLWNGPQ